MIKSKSINQFWNGKKVLITGHTGFKGAWLTFWLTRLGAKVSGVSLEPSTQPNLFSALDLTDACDHHIVDIRNRDKLSSVVKQINPEIVFHMAAQALVRDSYKHPIETYETNVIGTGNVLTSLLSCSAVKAIVVITTDKCYENREWEWGYRETDSLGGHDPYSSSKACAEILTASFRRSFFHCRQEVGLATVRAGNVIGGGDWSPDRLLPDAVRSVITGAELEIRNPGSIRPWQHVFVPLSGYMRLAQCLSEKPQEFSNAFNFAPADEDCVAVSSVLKQFGDAWGTPIPWSQSPGEHPHEAHFLKLDSSKAKHALGWRPAWNLEQALIASAEWYITQWKFPGEVVALSAKQIAAFTELL